MSTAPLTASAFEAARSRMSSLLRNCPNDPFCGSGSNPTLYPPYEKGVKIAKKAFIEAMKPIYHAQFRTDGMSEEDYVTQLASQTDLIKTLTMDAANKLSTMVAHNQVMDLALKVWSNGLEDMSDADKDVLGTVMRETSGCLGQSTGTMHTYMKELHTFLKTQTQQPDHPHDMRTAQDQGLVQAILGVPNSIAVARLLFGDESELETPVDVAKGMSAYDKECTRLLQRQSKLYKGRANDMLSLHYLSDLLQDGNEQHQVAKGFLDRFKAFEAGILESVKDAGLTHEEAVEYLTTTYAHSDGWKATSAAGSATAAADLASKRAALELEYAPILTIMLGCKEWHERGPQETVTLAEMLEYAQTPECLVSLGYDVPMPMDTED
ncbi:uncharacterized protein MKK02DRAFT_41418 [Dioszegia hungarica]|uniref:Uncharacterized protein n=1 Tax=Dioszegia hungarica TaxID=4972 RepID=A0AA38GZK7_9TREE|nr:uncharacterized protein MKK02DRAFT_41418 [Dioszegia hungarica]KAI9631788.1 hypothetical protein MKK02DRAFT_41418 [Dioszegia hungarica]